MSNNKLQGSASAQTAQGVAISEMAIVDTFTKLIFGEVDNYIHDELVIIDAFRAVEHSVTNDTYQEMAAYLRGLGVREMIGLVADVKAAMKLAGSVATLAPTIPAPGPGVLQRTTH